MSNYEPVFQKCPQKVEIKALTKSLHQIFLFRRTIRKISEEVIQNCIKIAAMAPSGANHQPWHFVAISSKTIKMKIDTRQKKKKKSFILVSIMMNGSEHLNL